MLSMYCEARARLFAEILESSYVVKMILSLLSVKAERLARLSARSVNLTRFVDFYDFFLPRR